MTIQKHEIIWGLAAASVECSDHPDPRVQAAGYGMEILAKHMQRECDEDTEYSDEQLEKIGQILNG